MFNAIKEKFRDMATIKNLCRHAETHALRDGQKKPGAEHFLLAALDLEDGTARRAFEKSGADPEMFKQAVERQYTDALQSIGFAISPVYDINDAGAVSSGSGVYEAAPSGQEIMKSLATARRDHAPLLGAHVVAIIAAMPHGVAARALRSMGVDAALLQLEAKNVASNYVVTG